MSNQPALQHTYLPHPADGLREKPRRGFWKTVLRIIAWGHVRSECARVFDRDGGCYCRPGVAWRFD